MENKRLIIDYMGYTLVNDEFIYPLEMRWLYTPYTVHEMETGIYEFTDYISDTNFDTSFDWLMPVVRKILYGSYSLEGVKLMKDVQNSLITCDINKTYNSVIKFIQWYNNQSHATIV